MQDRVRWGIVGPGKIAHQFAKDLKHSSSNAVLGAVASTSPERAKQFADQYNIPRYYTGYQDLYKDAEIDAVYVATTNNLHLKNSLDALDGGKAVLCEKPLTENLEDSKKLIDHAVRKKLFLMEGMWTYFLPTIRQAQAWVEEGRIGKIINIKSSFGISMKFDPESRVFNPALGGGSLLDIGIYPIALTWLFLKNDPIKYNIVETKAPSGVDYDVNMQLVYQGGEVANLHSSFKANLHNHGYIIGEEGYITIPDFWKSRECFLYQKEELVDKFIDPRKGNGFEFQIHSASNDILAGKLESETMPHQFSLKLQEYMAAIFNEFN